MTAYRFIKMQGAGNDFVIFDSRDGLPPLDDKTLRRIADRHFGIGCDQVLILEPPAAGATAPRYRIFNADGGEVGQCGNGARCLARLAVESGLAAGPDVHLVSPVGEIRARLKAGGLVEVDMGVPRLAPKAIPFEADSQADSYALQVDGQQYSIGAVSMGNPHAVLRVDDIANAPVAHLGPMIGAHPRFPEGANVGFLQVLGADRAALRVYERGSGETLACGTGACAAVVWGRTIGALGPEVRVTLPGGALVVNWSGEPDAPVTMAGPAERVFEGTIDL